MSLNKQELYDWLDNQRGGGATNLYPVKAMKTRYVDGSGQNLVKTDTYIYDFYVDATFIEKFEKHLYKFLLEMKEDLPKKSYVNK